MRSSSWVVVSCTASSGGFSAAENPERGGLGSPKRDDDCACMKVFDGVRYVVGERGRRSIIASWSWYDAFAGYS
jgi:hypothetical protein